MKRKEINIYNCKNTIKITVNIKSKQEKIKNISPNQFVPNRLFCSLSRKKRFLFYNRILYKFNFR